MGLWSGIFKAARSATHVVEDVPFLGKAMKMMPVVGNVLSAVDLGLNVEQMLSPSNGPANGMPGMTPDSGGGLPQLAGMGGMGGMGGGQMVPGSGVQGEKYMSLSQMPAMIPPTSPLMRTYHRAPRGYVIMHAVVNGQVVAYALRKDVAKAQGHKVRHHHKPPISVGEWHALQKSHHVIKKMRKVDKMVHALARRAVRGTGAAAHHQSHKKGK